MEKEKLEQIEKIVALLIFVTILILLFNGCAHVGNKQITNKEVISKIKIGTSTKGDVRKLCGEPSKVTFAESGDVTWDYVYAKSHMKGTTFIPVVGLFAGGTKVENTTLTVRFNKDGIVKAVGTGKTSGAGGGIGD